ncbi:MAG: hypothetical protein GY749_14500 [Desulfobacteraceae bacterium]|nr:hypothetical protein [Desulfobacteraceae bacterium]
MKKLKENCSVLILFVIISFFAGLMSGCGSSGGMEESVPGGDDPEDPPVQTYNFTGTVYNKNGTGLSEVSVTVFSDTPEDISTDSVGSFAAKVSETVHTILVSEAGYSDVFKIVKIPSGGTHYQPVMLKDFPVTSSNVLAKSGKFLISNYINDKIAKLNIPAQSSGTFEVGSATGLNNTDIGVEYIDISVPLPVPTPSPDTLDATDVLIGGKQAPGTLISIKPALLKMATPATLTLPNPYDLVGTRILKFDPYTSKWKKTGVNTDNTPGDGTEFNNVTEGGIYGIFYEVPKTATVKGTATPNSLIFVGDEVVEVNSSGTFNVNVTVPPDELIDISALDSDTGKISTRHDQKIEANTIITVNFLFGTEPAIFTIGRSAASVKSDNSDKSIITAIVMDEDRAPVENAVVKFNASGGYISAGTVETDSEGKAVIDFSAGTDRANQLVEITAIVDGIPSLGSETIHVQITGTEIQLTTDKTILEKAELTIKLTDAAQEPVNNSEVVFSTLDPGSLAEDDTMKVSLALAEGYTSFYTDDDGVLKVIVTGVFNTGDVSFKTLLLVVAGGAKATQSYLVTSDGTEFKIVRVISKDGTLHDFTDGVSINTGEEIQVTVSAENRTAVRFSASIGAWESNGKYEDNIIDAPVQIDDTASAWFKSDAAGLSTIQVVDVTTPQTMVLLSVTVSAPPEESARLILQTDTSVVPVGGESTLRATVKNELGHAVGGASVVFSMENNAGDESISPVIVETDGNGLAIATFKAGSTASSAQGVTVKASVHGKENTDDEISIIIGGVVTSINISDPTKIANYDGAPETTYSLPMSIQVADAGGSAVAGVRVSLSVWPHRYATGLRSGETSSPPCTARWWYTAFNEDDTFDDYRKRNLILDEGVDNNGNAWTEDKDKDGELTPNNTAAGTVSSSVVETNDDGIAEFNLIFPKSSSDWVEAEITASTVVYGTESRTVKKFWLGHMVGEECNLSHSPFNTLDQNRDPYYVFVEASPDSLIADGVSQSSIKAEVYDILGTPVKDGVSISFETTAGTLSASSAEIKDGIAEVKLTSPTYIGSATITAKAKDFEDNDVSGGTIVAFVPGSPVKAEIKATPSSLTANGASTSTIEVKVYDTNYNAVADGETITFDIPEGLGTLSSRSAVTSGGTVSVVYTSGTTEGIVRMTIASAVGPELGTVDLILRDTVPGGLGLVPGSASIIADGTSNTVITATITDTDGGPVKDGVSVIFTTTAGHLNSPGGSTSYSTVTAGGQAYVTLYSSTNVGTANITATAGGASGSTSVTFVSGTIASIDLTASPDNMLADGTSTSEIRTDVRDKDGNAIDGEVITFSIVSGGGTLSPPTATTSGGLATVVYTVPSANEGNVTIKAESTNNISETIVIFMSGGSKPAKLSIGTSRISVKSDNSDSATITATVQDDNNAGLEDVTVAFSSSGGYISASSAKTGTDGTAQIQFSSGTGKKANDVFTVTASVAGLDDKIVPVQVTGTTVTLSSEKTNLDIEGEYKDTLSVKVRDAGLVEIYDAEVTVTVIQGNPSDPTAREGNVTLGTVENNPYTSIVIGEDGNLTGKTDVSGEIKFMVTGKGIGYATLEVKCLKDTKFMTYQITSVDETFAIVNPVDDPISIYTRNSANLAILVSDKIKFEAPDKITRSDDGSFLDDKFAKDDRIMLGGSKSNDTEMNSESGKKGYFTLTFVSDDTMIVNTEEGESVEDEPEGNEITITNSLLITVRNPQVPEKTKYVQFATSNGKWDNTEDMIIVKQTGSNGLISAVFSSTDAATSDIQVSDSSDPQNISDTLIVAVSAPVEEAERLTLQASSRSVQPSIEGAVNTVTLTATVKNDKDQVVGGAPIAFSIEDNTGGGERVSPIGYTNNMGVATAVFTSGTLSSGGEGVTIKAVVMGVEVSGEKISDEVSIIIGSTATSVVISDASEITVVSPTTYRMPMSVMVSDANGNPVSGAAVSLGLWPSRYATGYRTDEEPCPPIIFREEELNEDADRNTLLDKDEDRNDDGKITPPNSSGGSIPPSVETDQYGVGNFNLTYPKGSSGWVEVEVTATVMVSGSESQTVFTTWLNYVEDEGCDLNHSLFNASLKPDPYIVRVTSGSNSLEADGVSSTTITARVMDITNDPVEDETEVYFKTTAGTLSETLGKTKNGEVEVTLTSPIFVGTATITATVKNKDNDDVTGSASIEFTPGVPAKADVRAVPSTLPADNVSTSEIIAEVFDANNNPVDDDQLIVFTVDKGRLSSITATTLNGIATVTYTASADIGTATITVKGSDETPLDSVPITLIPAVVQSVAVVPGYESITADGTSTTRIRATVTDINGAYVPDGTIVSFETTAGAILDINSGQPAATASTANGIAMVDLLSSEIVGTATVTASSGGVDGKADVKFEAGPVASITLSANPDSLYADGTSTSTIRADVRDAKGNAIGGEEITFNITQGGGTLSAPTSVTSGGVATVTLTAPSTYGKVVIRAKSVNGQTSDFLSIAISPSGPVEMTIEAAPEQIYVPLGDSPLGVANKSVITVTMLTTIDDEKIAIGDSPVTIRDVTGVGGTTPWPDNDIVQGNGNGSSPLFFTKGGTVTFTISNIAALTSFAVTLWNKTTNERVNLLNTISPVENVEVSGFLDAGTYFLEVDAYGDWTIEVEGDVEADESDLGEEKASGKTGDDGTYTYTYNSTKVAGTVTLKAISGTTEAKVDITQLPGPANKIELSADPLSVYANGYNTITFTANVRDENNNLVRDINNNDTDVEVAFEIESGTGTLENADETGKASVITVGGVATVKLVSPAVSEDNTAGTENGNATVKASISDPEITTDEGVTVSYIGVSLADMIASPASIESDGVSESAIRVRLNDSNGVAVQGERVDFFITEGTGTLKLQHVTTDEAGLAETTFISPVNSSSPTTILARYGLSEENSPKKGVSVSYIVDQGPKPTGIELSAEPPSVPAGGSQKITITAKVIMSGGEPAEDGIQVLFELTDDSDGALEVGTFSGGLLAYTTSTANGSATAKVTSGKDPNTVKVKASIVDADVNSVIDIIYTPGDVELIVVPSSVLGTGQSPENRALITAILTKQDGKPVEKDEVVSFEVDDLTFGYIDKKQAPTDDLGIATAYFYGTAVGGTATVTAKWDTGGTTITQSATVTVHSPPNFIRVTDGFPNPNVINIKGTGGQSTARISFDVQDSDGNPVTDGFRINFKIADGPGGGELISPLFDLTSGGKVSTVLRSGSAAGPVNIKAYYAYNSEVSTNSSQIAIVSGQPVGEEFSIWVDHLNISGLWRFGLKDITRITAGDIYGNNIPDNTAISFKTYNTGGLFVPGSGVTISGEASSTLTSTQSPAPMQGAVSLTAEAINGGKTTHVTCMAVIPELESDPEYNHIVYAGTDGGGVYRSLDSGSTWESISRSSTHPGQNWIQPYVNDIAVDPDDMSRIYAATGYGGRGHIYRSLDGGINWNSGNPEEWDGLMSVPLAVLTILCDDDGQDDPDLNECEYNRGYFNDNYQFVCEGTYKDPDYECDVYEPANKVPCYRHVWFGTDGDGLYYSQDGNHFVRSDTLGVGKKVTDIVKVEGTHMKDARLYAATSTGVYKSEDGGQSWSLASSKFTMYTNTLALYPPTFSGQDIIYAGTEISGVWVSTDSGQSWAPYNSGLGKGLSATVPIGDIENAGNGVMSEVTVFDDCESERWTITCHEPTTDEGAYFSVYGSVSGEQAKHYYYNNSVTLPKTNVPNKGEMKELVVSYGADENFYSEKWTVTYREATGKFEVIGDVSDKKDDYDIETGIYEIENVIEFTIIGTGFIEGDYFTFNTVKREDSYLIEDVLEFSTTDGVSPFQNGDFFTFYTTRDEGNTIKDLLVDVGNNRLYAVTYFDGELEPHRIGNLYIHELEDGYMSPGDWTEANTGLPEYQPPEDTTLFAQHVIVPNIPKYPTTLFIGGDGISLSKATNGLSAGKPEWQESKTGLSNLIMARTPIIFSGECSLTVRIVDIERGGDNQGPSPLNTPLKDGDVVTFHIYTQDRNGNPPVDGSELKVIRLVPVLGGYTQENEFTATYKDVLTYQGTWRDLNDDESNRPFVVSVTMIEGHIIRIHFTPHCGDASPGCSGGELTTAFTVPYEN